MPAIDSSSISAFSAPLQAWVTAVSKQKNPKAVHAACSLSTATEQRSTGGRDTAGRPHVTAAAQLQPPRRTFAIRFFYLAPVPEAAHV